MHVTIKETNIYVATEMITLNEYFYTDNMRKIFLLQEHHAMNLNANCILWQPAFFVLSVDI